MVHVFSMVQVFLTVIAVNFQPCFPTSFVESTSFFRTTIYLHDSNHAATTGLLMGQGMPQFVHSTWKSKTIKVQVPKEIFGETDILNISWTSREPSCQQLLGSIMIL